jgi:uncharacterized cupredoxin-like copper-binding protein
VRRRTARLVAGALATAMVSSAGMASAARLHRAVEPPADQLPTGLLIDEDEWSVTPSSRLVAAGPVRFSIANRGEDDHDFAVLDAAGQVQRLALPPGAQGTLTAELGPGIHKVWCSLPGHEQIGMASYINVTDQVGAYGVYERDLKHLLDRKPIVWERIGEGGDGG